MFLGSLPASAYLHLRQLSLFIMICHLNGNILKSHANYVLTTCKDSSKSWFLCIRDLCIKYGLPHPLQLLEKPPSKEQFKKVSRLKVNEYWHTWYSSEVSSLSSLHSLHTPYLSLSVPHPIWTTLDGNPYQTKAASVQALFLSGRYRSERLRRHWSMVNRNGYCLNPSCFSLKYVEDEIHILLRCSAYTDERRRLTNLSMKTAHNFPLLQPIMDEYLNSSDDDLKLQFLLDCSTLPLVIYARQNFGFEIMCHLFKFTRIWCLNIHKSRMKMLGRPA